MNVKHVLQKLQQLTLRSRIEESLSLLDTIWSDTHDYVSILEVLAPSSLTTFSHRFPNIHVPKELEYLDRFLGQVPQSFQIYFLNRFTEYLAWSPKYVTNAATSFISGRAISRDPRDSYLEAMESRKGLAALFYLIDAAETNLQEALCMLLQVGCIDVSQSLGHYFSCTESVIKLASKVGLPAAKNHLFQLTMYLMQSSSFRSGDLKEPSSNLEDILTELVKMGGFYEYHYLILVNGLINQREFIDEKYFQHALAGVEALLPTMTETLSTEKLYSMTRGLKTSGNLLHELKGSIWKANASQAYALLRRYLDEEGVTTDLTSALAHTYVMIDDHPHDPHYVTFPISAFELTRHLNPKDTELALAHVIEFAVERVRSLGIAS
jgi:hypothetical protein